MNLDLEIESDSDSELESNRLSSNATSTSLSLLYPNSQITIDKAVLNFMDSYINNNKTIRCVKSDLNLLRSALPKSNRMPKTVYKLFNYVMEQAFPYKVTVHYCYKLCKFYYGTTKYDFCKVCNSDGDNISFYDIDIVKQIRYLFQCTNLSDILDEANVNRNTDANVTSDITDGSEYKRVNIDRKWYDLTLMLSIDGACLKNSSKATLWPISFMIAEVPSHLRRSFIGYTGIWYTESKPDM